MSTRVNVVRTSVYDLLFKVSKLPPEEVATRESVIPIPPSNEVQAYAEKMANIVAAAPEVTEQPTDVAKIQAAVEDIFDEMGGDMIEEMRNAAKNN